MRLLLVRHGATANNVQARYTGQTDVPMSALGERQAAALGARLAPLQLDTIVTSDLRRARAMAEEIASRHDCPLLADADLREISLGSWEGATFNEISETQPKLLAHWQSDPAHWVPPGGESLTDFAARVAGALERWCVGGETLTEAPRTVLWVTHGGVIGVALCLVLGLPLNRRWQFRRDNASICEIELGPDDKRDDAIPRGTYAIVMRSNDTAHLETLRGEEPGEASQML